MTAATNFVAEPFRISARLVSRANNLIPGGAPYLRPVEASVDLVVLGLVIAWYSRAHRHSYNVEQGCRSAILILSIYWRDGIAMLCIDWPHPAADNAPFKFLTSDTSPAWPSGIGKAQNGFPVVWRLRHRKGPHPTVG